MNVYINGQGPYTLIHARPAPATTVVLHDPETDRVFVADTSWCDTPSSPDEPKPMLSTVTDKLNRKWVRVRRGDIPSWIRVYGDAACTPVSWAELNEKFGPLRVSP